MANVLAQLQNFFSSPLLSSALIRRIGIVLAAIFGILYCLYGYRLMRFISTAVGAVIGCAAGYAVADAVSLTGTTRLVLIVAFAVGIGLLGFFLEKAGVFIAVFIAGFGVGVSFATSYTQLDSVVVMVIGLVIGVVLAVLSIIYMRPVIIVSTALIGGLLFSDQVFSVVHIAWDAQLEMYIRIGTGLVLAVIGIVYQFRSTRGR